MKQPQPIIQLLHRLWHHLGARQGQFFLLLALIVLVSLIEMLSIGAVLPFLGVLTAPDNVYNQIYVRPIFEYFGFMKPSQIILPVTITFGFIAVLVGAMRLLLLWATNRLAYSAGSDLSISIYRRTLYQPYSIHIARNSSEIINGITGKVSNAISVIMLLLTVASSCIMLTAILAALLAIDPVMALSAFFGFGLIYFVIFKLTRKSLLDTSLISANESTNVIKALQEGLGGIRDVLIDGSQSTYCRIYQGSDLPLRKAQAASSFIATSPKYAIEALGLALIAGLSYSMAIRPDGFVEAIPILGAMAFSAQRLLPILQQAYSAWSSINGMQVSLEDVLELLDQPLPNYAINAISPPAPFFKLIQLNQLSFRYSQKSPFIFNNLSLSITKGSRVGFIGASGSGKTTLLDIVMGLLQPTSGTLEVDGVPITLENQRGWQAHIAHVPQSIFLTDGTLEENIAFGVPIERIDSERVKLASQQAQIADLIESWPNQYQTRVGERGIRISGGQRQRIGIARALYKKADVIIFDEATSALDYETENAVMRTIEGLSEDLTILIIAHRLTTLQKCSQIIEIGDQGYIRSTSYREIYTQTLTSNSS